MRVEKKILPEYFDHVLSGQKTYDFRLADFHIKPGDILVLKEWDKKKQQFTGREVEKSVTYVGKTKGDTSWSKEEIEKYGYQIISLDSSRGLAELQKKIREFCDDREWDQFHNPKDLSISLALEAAEVMEHFQWKNKKEMTEHVTKMKKEVGEELADVFYWVLLLANKLSIDLVEAFEEKMSKNAKKYPIEKAKGSHKKYTEL